MNTRYRVWLDGQPLDGISEKVIIMDISETPPSITTTTASRPNGDGAVVARQLRNSIEVQVSFEIHEYSIVERQAILDRIALWCTGRVMTANTRPNKQLRVTCTAFPSIASALRWTDTITVTFTAFERPYWESVEPALVEGEEIVINGTAPTALYGEVVHNGPGYTDEIVIRAESSVLHLKGISLQRYETLHIDHDDRGYLTLRITGLNGERSVYSCMQEDSGDDLIVNAGMAHITSEAFTDGNKLRYTYATLYYRPRWR